MWWRGKDKRKGDGELDFAALVQLGLTSWLKLVSHCADDDIQTDS